MIYINIINSTNKRYLPKKKIKKMAEKIFFDEKIKKVDINIVFVDDNYIHGLNKTYLNHDYPTDVIAFSLEGEDLEGEIYISVDRAFEQSKLYGVSFSNELMRLAAHGALHLAGYDDSDTEKQKIMTELENKYIYD